MMDQVCILVRCLLPEKLLQRAMDAGVRFIAVEPLDRALRVTLRARDARRFLKLCQKFSIPAEVLSRRGGSAFLRWLRGRWTVLVGLLAGFVACGLFLSHIWFIDVAFTGDAADTGDAGTILAMLEEMEIRPGASRRIDAAALSSALLARAGDLSYVGARVEGVRLFIEAAPEVKPPEVYDVEAPRSLYADRDGIVVSVKVEAGEPCVKPGDAVRKGQLLILGEEKRSKEAMRPIAALGEVVVRAWFEGAAEGRLREAQVRYTGRQSVSSMLKTPWLALPITEGARFEHQATETDDLPIGGLFLPLTLTRVTRRETRSVMEDGDRALLTGRLAALAMADARTRLTEDGPRRFEITRCWVSFEPKGDALRASAVCEILTNAAAAR